MRPFSWREALSAEAVRKAAPRRLREVHRPAEPLLVRAYNSSNYEDVLLSGDV